MDTGKHVLLEKPAACSTREIQEMIKIANQRKEISVMDCSCRHSRLQPKFRAVKQLIDSGALGDVYLVHHNSNWPQSRPGIEYHPDAKWFLDKSIAGGGVLLDWGVYDLSFHLGILGDQAKLEKINSIFFKKKLDQVHLETFVFDVEEHFVAHMDFSNGIRYYWERGNNAHMHLPNETRIYGNRGGVKLNYCTWDNPDIEFFHVDNHGKGKSRKDIVPIEWEGHVSDDFQLANHFLNVLDKKEKNKMPLELAAKHLDIIWKLYQYAGL